MGVNDGFSYSKQGLELTEQFEGCKLTAYKDGGGVLTIGYGHTGHDVLEGMVITQEQAEQFLIEDVKTAESAVKRLVTIKLTQDMFSGLVDIVFNIGNWNFAKSTLLKKLNAGDLHGAAEEFEKWSNIAGKHSDGLARRRVAEQELFEHGIVS